MKIKKTNNNRNYIVKNSGAGLTATLTASLPRMKRAKSLTIKSGNVKLNLNGRQINLLKTLIDRAAVITDSK